MGNCHASDCITSFTSLYEIPIKDMDGRTQVLGQYQGKVLLVVNVASGCGLTDKHYRQLVELHGKYMAKGLVILGFPCNQFMGQESGECPMILDFAHGYGVEFQLFDKVEVNGPNACELFKFLRANSRLKGSKIGWNFGKFLISREGNVHNYYGPRTNPAELIPDIERLLGTT